MSAESIPARTQHEDGPAAAGPRRYRTEDVPVPGGLLRVGIWDPEPGSGPHADGQEGSGGKAEGAGAGLTVLAIHGITASHMAWLQLAEALPGARIIAPDLRGRGRSNTLPGPFGMDTHAADMAAVIAGIPGGPQGPVVVVGHSMGAFVTVALAKARPDLVAAMVLVDGGLPLQLPEGITGEQVMTSVLGPAAARLSMTFESREAYRDFWRRHPAFQDWNETISAYVDYDLVGEEPKLRPSSNIEAIAADAGDLSAAEAAGEVLAEPPGPLRFLRAPRGLLNEDTGLYSPEYVRQWAGRAPLLQADEVAGVNHYTIIMSERGVERLSAAVHDVARDE